MANVFTEAKKYQKSHPKTAWQACIKAVSGKKHKTAIKKAAPKKKAAVKRKAAVAGVKPKAKKLKIKIKPGKKGGGTFTISGIHMTRLDSELRHCESLQEKKAKHQAMLKEKGQTAGEKMALRREIAKYNTAIATSKKHIAALKRSI